MYTECPACHTVFRVTAKALQQASGRVRCGGCGRAFSALDFLSEDRPDTGSRSPPKPDHADDAIARDGELTESNRLLLKKLDDLAGPDDVLIEDTGTEWRVLDSIFADTEAEAKDADEREATEDDEQLLAEAPDDFQGSLDLEELRQASADAWRFDDDTPHPDSIDKDEGAQTRGPQRRSDDLADDHGMDAFDETQMDFALSEAGDWSELLDEFGPEQDAGDENENDDSAREENSFEVEEELAAIHSELSAKESPADKFGNLRFELQEDAAALASPAEDEDADEVADELPDDDPGSTSDEAPTEVGAEEPAEDQRDAVMKADFAAHGVETIVLEGDSIRSALEHEFPEMQPDTADAYDPQDTLFAVDMPDQPIRGGRRSSDPAGYGVIAGTVLLALLLLGQVVHGYRETLSTYGLFNQTIGPLYHMLGKPVAPEWNIQGWQFEATNGNVADDDNVLTIFSRIGNKSELPLPYPLVHVSLTDRWEEIVGSRVLAPYEYLAGDLDPGRPVRPGDNFTAVISIADPSADATGFKVNVCYPADPGQIRCATEDFKN